jgi:hypothetical protein
MNKITALAQSALLWLVNLLPHFDIVKTVEVTCSTCKGLGFESHRDGLIPCDRCKMAGRVNETVVYLRRHYLIKTKWFNIFIHEFFRSDDDPDPHDHPFDFLTFVLKGGYTDESFDFYPSFEIDKIVYRESNGDQLRPYHMEVQGVRSEPHYEVVKPGQVVFRRAEHIHRVLLTNGKAWTIVVTGGNRRPWGFIKKGTWVFWRLYLGVWGDHYA